MLSAAAELLLLALSNAWKLDPLLADGDVVAGDTVVAPLVRDVTFIGISLAGFALDGRRVPIVGHRRPFESGEQAGKTASDIACHRMLHRGGPVTNVTHH